MPKGGKEAFLSKVTFRRESNWYSNTKQMLKDMKTTEEIIQEILDEQHECRWMDTSDLEIYLRRVATAQKAIDIANSNKYLKRELSKLAMDEINDNFLENEFKIVLKSDIQKWLDGNRKAIEK